MNVFLLIILMVWLVNTVRASTFQELQDVKAANLAVFRSIEVSESNLFLWKGLIVPVSVISLTEGQHFRLDIRIIRVSVSITVN